MLCAFLVMKIKDPRAMQDIQGVGIGLRHRHFKEFIEDKPNVPWLEVHTENFFSQDSTAAKYLREIRKVYPMSAHCVGLSLGSANTTCPVREQHLQKLKRTIDWLQPTLVSDHLSWSASDGVHYLPDLLPIPFTEEALKIVTQNINRVQDVLQRQILIENPSSYLNFLESPLPEYEFLSTLVENTSCGLLLDLNNVYVSAHNQDFDPLNYIENIPLAAVKEMHLAGYSIDHIEGKDVYIDTHGQRVYEGVWQLYQQAIKRFGAIPTLIEWDSDVPELSVLLEEKSKADVIVNNIINEQVK